MIAAISHQITDYLKQILEVEEKEIQSSYYRGKEGGTQTPMWLRGQTCEPSRSGPYDNCPYLFMRSGWGTFNTQKK